MWLFTMANFMCIPVEYEMLNKLKRTKDINPCFKSLCEMFISFLLKLRLETKYRIIPMTNYTSIKTNIILQLLKKYEESPMCSKL